MTIASAILNQYVPSAHPYNTHGPERYKRSAESVMAEVDAMPFPWRQLVHEYGLGKVQSLRKQFHSPDKAAMHMIVSRLEIDL